MHRQIQTASKRDLRIMISIFVFMCLLSVKHRTTSSNIAKRVRACHAIVESFLFAACACAPTCAPYPQCDIMHIARKIRDLTLGCYFRLAYAPHAGQIEATRLLLWLGGANPELVSTTLNPVSQSAETGFFFGTSCACCSTKF